MAYAKRYAGGFIDKPSLTTPIDSAFLNAVEAALVELVSTDGSVDGQVLQWIAAQSKFGPALLLNKNIDAAAAIDKSKLNLAGQIANADISGAAAIDRSKLNFGAGLVNADIAAAAAILASKIAGYPADGTKVLKGDGTWGVVTPTIYRKVTPKTVNTTTVETDLLNGEITIAAGVMGTSGMLRGSLFFDILQNVGAVNWRFRIKLGATTIFDTGASFAPSTSAVRQFMNLEFKIMNLGAANSQESWFRLEAPSALPNALTIPTTLGLMAAPPSMYVASAVNATAIDTTVANVLSVTVQHSGNSASQETKLYAAVAEVV